MRVLPRWPTRLPIFSRGSVSTLSTIICDTRLRPFCRLGWSVPGRWVPMCPKGHFFFDASPLRFHVPEARGSRNGSSFEAVKSHQVSAVLECSRTSGGPRPHCQESRKGLCRSCSPLNCVRGSSLQSTAPASRRAQSTHPAELGIASGRESCSFFYNRRRGRLSEHHRLAGG
ncbi:MAG: hypothetical protein QOJ42_5546 [Acidobacteriaceae bacterium]|jgi:hypothetical protein|nr:hypothetical protein [Acidobacteriaceae bacterium]